jgi:two-component system sensor histidine kinase YesM
MSVVPLLVFALISYGVSNHAIEKKISNYSVQTMKAVKKIINYECEKYEQIADLVIINSKVQKGLKEFSKMNPIEKNECITSLNQVMSNYMSNQPNIMQIYLLDTERTPIYNQGWFYFNPDKLAELVELSENGVNWLSITEANLNYVIYTKPVLDRNGKKILGYISIHLNPDTFTECFSSMNLGSNSSFIILDQLGHVVASQNKDLLRGEALDDTLFKKCMKQSKNPIIKNYEIFNRKNMVAYTLAEKQRWTSILLMPNTYLQSEYKTIAITTILCSIVCIICAIIVYYKMKVSINEPLSRLVQLVGDAANHRFDQEIVDDSRDELGYLGRTFSQLTKTMRELILQSEEEQRMKRESELNMLQAQINPHFLFNTLNSLRWTAMMSGAENVSNGLTALSTLLANTIIDKNQFVTIETEIKNIESYIAIQRIRYGDTFSVSYNIDQSIYSCYMIKFLLQPIVENAIIHGVNEAVTTNRIEIVIVRKNDNLLVTIADNGKGFDITKLSDNHKSNFCGFALKNVKERITLCFEQEYLFEILSKSGEGTVVRFEMPMLEHIPDMVTEGEE